jgi:hypothetical protein
MQQVRNDLGRERNDSAILRCAAAGQTHWTRNVTRMVMTAGAYFMIYEGTRFRHSDGYQVAGTQLLSGSNKVGY